MTERVPIPPAVTDGAGAARRRRPPTWGILLFLVLLGGLLFANYCVSVSGPSIAWIENDIAAALHQADAKHQRVFLYLYEPNEPVHLRNEREIFPQRWAQQPLNNVICCRAALAAGDVNRLKYNYTGKPLFLLLDSKGTPLTRTEGAVDQLQFETHIGKPAQRH